MESRPQAMPPRGRLDAAALAGLPLFAGVDAAALTDAARDAHTRLLRKGALLFEQGAEADALHLLLRGRLKAVQAGPEGEQIVVRFLGPGEPAGVFALFGAGHRYPASAIAVTDSVVASWEGPRLAALLERCPAVLRNAMRAIGGRVEEAHTRLREMAAERVEQRIAHAVLRLLRQAGRQEADGSVALGFPVSRQDIAEMSGTTLYTASRILSRWEREGILEGGRRPLRLRDPQALRRIAEGGQE